MIKNRSEQGSALMLVMIIVFILVGISGAYMSLSWWNTKRAGQDEDAAQALYIAESGAAAYINYMNANTSTVLTPPVRTKQFLAGGYWWVPTENIVDFADSASVGANNYDKDYASFQVAGRYNKTVRRVNVLVTHKAGGAFWNAIFAGNKANDPTYTLNLTGSTATGRYDTIKGDIYTGNGINATGDAQLQNEAGNGQGKVTYKNTNTSTVTGPSYTQGSEPDLDIPRTFGPSANMTQAEANAKYNYTGGTRDSNGTAWIDVAGQFTASGTAGHNWAADGSYGTDILDVNNPAHIFRKNPSSRAGAGVNRTATYEQTVNTTTVGPAGNTRNDYYLEDPTNTNLTQTSLTGHSVNGDTSASMLNVNSNNNNAVYFIDGNLRVSGENIKSYQFNPATGTGDLKMTMIVKGNVSLTDNLLYPQWESSVDALAIIAITDSNYPNTTAAQFAVGTGSTALTPNGVSIDTFIAQYNARAATARSNSLNMPDLDLSTTAGQARASQEYNKIYGSGNVFFGDPGSGTVEHFESFMYAENNFYATNLDATTASGGTGRLEIYGNMTAGNQVSIDRTTTAAGYIPLKVTFDPIIKNNGAPPGLPAAASVAGQDWRIATWKQSTNTAETGGDK